MSESWPRVSLGELIRLERRPVKVNEDASYQEIGIYCFGRGIFHKTPRTGLEVGEKGLFLLKGGDFILQVTFAWEGAVAVVSEAEEGMYGSTRYPTFRVSKEMCLPEFLVYYFRTSEGVRQLVKISPGSAGRNRVLSLKRIPEVTIPLPSLADQRRIVERVDELAAKIEEAKALRNHAAGQADGLLASEEWRIWPDERLVGSPPLQEVTSFLARGRQSEQGDSSHFLIKTQHVQQGRYLPTAMRLSPHAAGKVRPDATTRDRDILIACSAAGCLGRVARYIDDGRVTSTDTHVAIARPNQKVIDADYLYAYLRGAQGQHQIRSRERGDWKREKISFRLTELNLNDLRAVPVPVPSLPDQRRIVAALNALQAEVDKLKRLQANTAAELDALLPSILDKAFKGEL